MPKITTSFVKSSGLNNTQPSTRMEFDPQSGSVELAEAWNTEIDDTGRPFRTKGYAATTRTEDSKSMFNGRSGTFFVSGTTLYKLNSDFTRTAVHTGLTAGALMSYVEVLNTIYFANGYEIGMLVNGVYTAWLVGTYYGPVTTRQFSAPPIGSLLEVYNGSMCIASDNVLWFSERFGFNLFDKARNFVWFESNIKMVKAVADGIYVSTETKIVFLKGTVPSEFQQINISNYPAIPGTGIKANAEEMLDGKMVGPATIRTSLNGIYMGFSGGECKCLTERRITLPNVSSGCAVLHDGRYLVILKQ